MFYASSVLIYALPTPTRRAPLPDQYQKINPEYTSTLDLHTTISINCSLLLHFPHPFLARSCHSPRVLHFIFLRCPPPAYHRNNFFHSSPSNVATSDRNVVNELPTTRKSNRLGTCICKYTHTVCIHRHRRGEQVWTCLSAYFFSPRLLCSYLLIANNRTTNRLPAHYYGRRR